MCGIAGIVAAAAHDDAHRLRSVERMLASIAHRGPDESLSTSSGAAHFGTVRLALVDMPTSRQPMADAAGRYLLSFNGEVYNFAELRSALEAAGHSFRTAGDTEVVLHALMEWGTEAFARFRGQFAIAFWDADRRRLLLARDRLGIVPLFWTRTPAGELIFASEIKAFADAGLRTPMSLPDIVDAGVLWGLHPGRTAFHGVSSVPAGGFVESHDGHETTSRYWAFAFADQRDDRSIDEQAKELLALLTAAVERRVPHYGDPAVLLSGGLDSSAVLAALRSIRPDQTIDSFSIQFAQEGLNEAPFQALVSDHFGTHHDAIVCDDESVAAALELITRHAELPLMRTAPGSSIALAERIKHSGSRAVLSGEGADELFCGYDVFKVASIRDAWAADPDSPAFARMLEKALAHQEQLGRGASAAFYERGLEHRDDPVFSHLHRWSAAFRITQYLAEPLREQTSLEGTLGRVRDRLPDAFHGWSTVEKAQYLEVTYFLGTSLLATQCDRPFMAQSVECRYPFLDEDVIDFALTLPETSKLNELNEKLVLKEAVRDHLPRAITERVKQPYTAPEGGVFCSPTGRALLDRYLSPDAVADTGVFDPRRVAWLIDKTRRSRTSFHDDLALVWILSTTLLVQTYGFAEAGADLRRGTA
ncbi:MAG: asparagine synthase (glutamine-hydrolyzing) [Aeromicrobium sp.]